MAAEAAHALDSKETEIRQLAQQLRTAEATSFAPFSPLDSNDSDVMRLREQLARRNAEGLEQQQAMEMFTRKAARAAEQAAAEKAAAITRKSAEVAAAEAKLAAARTAGSSRAPEFERELLVRQEEAAELKAESHASAIKKEKADAEAAEAARILQAKETEIRQLEQRLRKAEASSSKPMVLSAGDDDAEVARLRE